MKLLGLVTVLASAAASATGLVLIASAPAEIVPVGYGIAEMPPFLLLQLTFAAVGALLAWRRPANPIGVLLCATALVSAVLILLAGGTVRALADGDAEGAARMAWISAWWTLALGPTLGPALVSFPDGRVTSRLARASLAFLLLTLVLGAVGIAFRQGPLSSFPGITNPYAWPDSADVPDGALALAMTGGLAATVLGVSSQISRYRRASSIERQQLKWFLASAVVVSVLLVPTMWLMYGASDPTTASTQRYAGRVLGALSTCLLPMAIGIAVLRYRLYDLDLLINRTLVYGGLSALLVATYALGVVVFQAVLRPLTGGSEFAVALSTLLVAAVFQPFRHRVQDLVDRRFYRSRFDAARTLEMFGARLRDQVDLDSVRADLLGVVGETLRPEHASVWLRTSRK